MAATSPDRAEQAVRTQVWDAPTAADAVHAPSTRGRIPHLEDAGYSGIEFALLTEAGPVTPETPLVTTVHALRVTGNPIPPRAW
ncbi:hypothetical protein [Streptomyces prasinus]|uniref:hypothetical protein n=1 Tax=Streptomyces prasinus TaxID=67345 RepID=UPI0036BB4CA9